MISSDSTEPSANLLVERNGEKKAVSEINLSAAQHKAAQSLREQLTDGGLYNLVGPAGSGKTFLAWYLTSTHDDWSYFAWLPVKSTVNGAVVVIDNVAATRAASRRAREVRAFTNADSILILSETAVPEATEYIHLSAKS